MHDIVWAGKSLRRLCEKNNYHLVITLLPNLSRASRKVETYSIPGRNGQIVIPQNAWENTTLTYEILIGDGIRGHAPEAARLLADWLSAPKTVKNLTTLQNLTDNGYFALSDTFDVGFERRAFVADGYTIESKETQYALATITFNCRPERFKSNGFIFRSASELTNPFGFFAKPILKYSTVSTTGSIQLSNSNYSGTVTLTGLSEYIHIDSEAMDCYKTYGTNQNNKVTLSNGFPILAEGETTFTITSGATLEIMPRWWTL